MDITDKSRRRGTLITAVITLFVIGAFLLVSTWQSILRQHEAEAQHLFLSSRSVLFAVESSLRRGPMHFGEGRLTPYTEQLFQALERDGDVVFVGIIDQHGGRLLTSPVHGDPPISLPADMVAELMRDGQWSGPLTLGDARIYVYGKKLAPPRGRHMSMSPEDAPQAFLVVALDIDKYLTSYKGFQQNVIFQSLYMLAAALFCWGLAVSFLSQREQARKAVTLEHFQSRLLDNLPEGLITLDAHRVIRSANPAALAILRRPPEMLVGRPVDELPPDIAGSIAQQCANPAPTGWQRVDGEGAHLEILALPFTDDKADAFLAIIRDRTQLRSLEQSLAEAEKLAAVGALAAGVAHEVRNPLSSLRGFAQYFVKKLSGKQPEEEYAKTMVREADRLNRVITDLLFLARPKAIAPKLVLLEPAVREITQLLRLDLERKRVELRTELEALSLFADEEHLKQILLNLLLNSLDALPEGGEPLVVASGTAENGTWVEVRDKGCGMSFEQAERAFEPFFTAKDRGTGLGLALVRRAMRDHGGDASVFSEPGQGCRIRLLFPNETAYGHNPPAASVTEPGA